MNTSILSFIPLFFNHNNNFIHFSHIITLNKLKLLQQLSYEHFIIQIQTKNNLLNRQTNQLQNQLRLQKPPTINHYQTANTKTSMKQFTSKKKEETDQYDDEIDFEQHFKQIKIVLFKLFTFYNKKLALVPVFVFYLLDIVQFLQTLFYITNPSLGLYPQNGIIVSTFSQVLSYLNTFQLIKQNQGQNNFLLVVIAFFFLITTLILIYYSYLKIVKKELFWELKAKRGANGGFGDTEEGGRSKLQSSLLNLCVGSLLLIHTILTIPLYNILIPTFYCTSSSEFNYSFRSSPQCYDLAQILAIIMSIFSILALIAMKFCCLSLFYQRNPFKSSILTCDDNMGLLTKRLIVIALLVYYIADPEHSLLPLYVSALVAIYGGYLFLFRWQKIGFYNKKYMMFTQTMQVLLLCFSLNNLVQYFIPTDSDLGLYLLQFILCSISISYCASSVLESLKEKFMEKYYNNPQAVKRSGEVEIFWIQLINHLYHEEHPKRRRVNLKLLLKQLDLEDGSKLAQKQPQFVERVKKVLSGKQTLTLNRQKLIILQYLRILSEEILEQKQTFIFSGCRCSILYQEGYKTKSLCEISKLQSEKLSWMDEFFLQEIRQRNSSGTLEGGEDLSSEHLQKSRSNTNSNNQQLDEEKIVIYQQYISLISLLETKINTCLKANVQFWNQLLEEKPDFVYSKKLAKKILNHHKQIVSYNKNIQSVFTNSIKTKLLFYSYLQTLQWSQTHTEDILQFLEQNQYSLQERNSQKLVFNNLNTQNFHITFGENQKIVMIELDIANYQGYIKNLNSQVFNFLGYTKNQLIGRRIDKLLPSPIAVKHAQFVQNFMNRKESISRSSQRIVFAVHKNKFLVPGFLTIKVIYSQQKGMKLIAFIRPLYHEPRTFGILSHSDDTIIVGVTKQISIKVRDREFIAEMSNQSVYMELLFPKLKYDTMLPNKTYETEMTTFNNLEQQFMQEKNVKVSVRYQQTNYQQNLNLRYYFVTYEKVQMNVVNMLDANFLNLQSFQTRSEFPDVQTMNTHNIIDSFKMQREDEKKGKMEQLCIFKQNYLGKYNNSKYLVCMLIFLAVFGGVVAISVMVYAIGGQFQQSVVWTKQRIIQLSILSKDISILQTHWMNIYQINNDIDLTLAKQHYQQLSDEFQQNMLTFKSFGTVSDQLSLFNLKIIPQTQVGQNQRLRQILDFQTTALKFQDLSVMSSMSSSELQYVQLIRDELLNETANILQIYIGNELDNNLQMDGFYDGIQHTKFYYSMGVIGVQVGFLILTYIGLYYMKEYVQKNMELLHFLSYYEIRNITQSLNDFIKSNLSSQLQSCQPSILTDSQKPSTLNLPVSLKLNNSQLSNEKKVTLADQDSVFQFFKQDDKPDHGKNFSKKPMDKRPLQPEKKPKIGDKNQFKLPPKSNKDQKQQNDKITQGMGQLGKNAENKRMGTAISNASIHYRLLNNNKKDRLINRNRKLSDYKKPNNSIEKSTNRLVVQSSGDNMNQRAKKIELSKNRRLSLGKDSQVLQLSSSSIQISGQQSHKSLKQILEKEKNQKVGNLQHRRRLSKQSFGKQNESEQRRKEHKLSTLQQATIEMEYSSKFWWVLICVVVIGVFVGAKELLYSLEGSGESQMVAYGDSMNHLVKLGNQLMYLRSFISPYFMNMSDLSQQPLITNQSLFAYLLTVQSYTSVIYTDFLTNQQVLMNIERDIIFYMYLLQRFSPDSRYLSNLTNLAPPQLLQGVNRILNDLLARHDELMNEIAIIDNKISQNNQTVQIFYIMEISITIILSLIILIVQYYLLIWNLKVDEEATFRMIQFIPLQTMNGNKDLFRTIQKHSTKE